MCVVFCFAFVVVVFVFFCLFFVSEIIVCSPIDPNFGFMMLNPMKLLL